MFRSNVVTCAIAAALAAALPAAAQTPSNQDLEEIRRQIQELKESYESRIQALEKRLKEVDSRQIIAVAILTAVVLVAWFGWSNKLGHIGFYLVFGLSVTASGQLVGVYLVFATLIIPALATRNTKHWRLPKAYAVAALGYAVGLAASVWLDLPSGAVVVWTLAAAGIAFFALEGRRPAARL